MVETTAGQNEPQSPTHKSTGMTTARLFSLTIAVYLTACAAEFIFIARVFGANPAMAFSLLAAIPLVVGVRMRLRWNSVNALDFVPLVLVVTFATWGNIAVVQGWYAAGLHLNPGTWTLFESPSQEDLNWKEFGREFRKDPAFKDIKIELTERKHIYWASGTLTSENDLERLVPLANKCGIPGDRLDGPYFNSVSITIPGTSRATRYRD